MPTIETLALAAVAGLALLLALYLLIEQEVEEAVRKTRGRAVGVGTGALSVAGAAATLGLEVIQQLPEIAITMVGIGAIMTDVSWSVFAAIAFVVWMVAEWANGGPRGV